MAQKSSNKKNEVKTAQERIDEVCRSGETSINLSELDLEVLPSSINSLPSNLEELDISGNQLKGLPHDLTRFKKLKATIHWRQAQSCPRKSIR